MVGRLSQSTTHLPHILNTPCSRQNRDLKSLPSHPPNFLRLHRRVPKSTPLTLNLKSHATSSRCRNPREKRKSRTHSVTSTASGPPVPTRFLLKLESMPTSAPRNSLRNSSTRSFRSSPNTSGWLKVTSAAKITANLKRLQAINCYRGVRHRRGLPVRGQRTSTNARTRKGPAARWVSPKPKNIYRHG